MPDAEKSIKLTVMLDSHEMRLLKRLAESEHVGMSQMVRTLIHRASVEFQQKIGRKLDGTVKVP